MLRMLCSTRVRDCSNLLTKFSVKVRVELWEIARHDKTRVYEPAAARTSVCSPTVKPTNKKRKKGCDNQVCRKPTLGGLSYVLAFFSLSTDHRNANKEQMHSAAAHALSRAPNILLRDIPTTIHTYRALEKLKNYTVRKHVQPMYLRRYNQLREKKSLLIACAPKRLQQTGGEPRFVKLCTC